MPKYYRPSSIAQRWGKASRRFKAAIFIASAVVTLTGAIVGIAKAWPFVEPLLPAHREYVREVSEEARSSTAPILRDLQIELAEGKRDAVKNDLAKWQVELGKTQDAQTRSMIEKTLSEQQVLLDKLTNQLRTLNRVREKQ